MAADQFRVLHLTCQKGHFRTGMFYVEGNLPQRASAQVILQELARFMACGICGFVLEVIIVDDPAVHPTLQAAIAALQQAADKIHLTHVAVRRPNVQN